MAKILFPYNIQKFFNEIVEEIKISLEPEYILIAGSFGKGSWIYYNNKLLSDFEFVFIRKNRWSIKKKKDLLIKLNSKYPYDIHLKGYLIDKITEKVISNYSSRYLGYVSLDFFDTFFDPVILYSNTNTPLKINFDIEEIPTWEAWRLLVNRIGDLLNLKLIKNKRDNINDRYSWLKMFESIGDSYLIIKRLYHPNIKEKLFAFNNIIENDKSNLIEECKRSFSLVQKAFIIRQNHNLDSFNFNDLATNKEEIIYGCLNYFEQILYKSEDIKKNNSEFWENYLESFKIEYKYLETNGKLAIILSNLIRLIKHRELVNFYFKFYNFRNSWRHIVLLAISTMFKDMIGKCEGFKHTKMVLTKIVRTKKLNSLSDDDLILFTLELWEKLR
ncbi:MAG: hypothetical protein ACTSYZ_13515 [Candidatus Helarchaeota archaeon]